MQMPTFPRKKRVTDPFDEHARARLFGADQWKFQSGTQYSDDSDSLSLSYLVHGFLEGDIDKASSDEDSVFDGSDCDRVDSTKDLPSLVSDSANVAISLPTNEDPYCNLLIMHVSEAVEKFAFLRERNRMLFRRKVAAFLWERRHNAAVCETKQDTSRWSHEFIDVIHSEAVTWRYFVDLDFRAQFEIARPTKQFSDVLATVPSIFVGCAEKLKRTVSKLCEALSLSFRTKGLPVPPWRRNRFMQNKWFGACRRNAEPVQMAVNGDNCRLVGFEDTVSEAGRVRQGERSRTVY